MNTIKRGHIPANNPDMLRWNQRFHDMPMTAPGPCWILAQYQHLLPRSGTAIDIASGRGGNALLLAKHGLDTTAWDISDTALDQLKNFAAACQLPVSTHHVDLEQQLPGKQSADVLVISHYLDRTIFPELVAMLRPGGLLYYQTFVKTDNPSSGPGNPDWRLDKLELLSSFSGLKLLAYHEDNNRDYPPLTNEGLAGIVVQKHAINSTP